MRQSSVIVTEAIEQLPFTRKNVIFIRGSSMDEETYRKLLALDRDFQTGGEIYRWLQSSLGLSSREVKQIVKNTAAAADILRLTCSKGQMRFDLHPREFFETGKVTPAKVDCDGT